MPNNPVFFFWEAPLLALTLDLGEWSGLQLQELNGSFLVLAFWEAQMSSCNSRATEATPQSSSAPTVNNPLQGRTVMTSTKSSVAQRQGGLTTSWNLRDWKMPIVSQLNTRLQKRSLCQLHTGYFEHESIREPLRKKYGIFWEFFPYGGEGSPHSQNFCDLTK